LKGEKLVNERAFNLFTALLGFVLIILTSLLVTSMISTEESATSLINDLQDQARIESVSRLARADAIQIVNYGMRMKIDEWLRDSSFSPSDPDTWEDWDAIVDEFERKFGRAEEGSTQPLINKITGHLTGLFESYEFAFEGYRVRVINKGNFSKVLNPLLEKEVAEGRLLEVIECNGTPEDCERGTFYVNLNIAELSDEEYEQLPLLQVEYRKGSKTITVSDPLLPRNNMRFYFPFRFFKALSYARQFTHSGSDGKLDSALLINGGQDYGFLSPRIHNEFDAYALGICDYGYCYPRTNPLYPPEKKSIQKGCPLGAGAGSNQLDSVQLSFSTPKHSISETYNPGSADDMKEKLKKIASIRLCEIAENTLGGVSDSDFEVVSSAVQGTSCYIAEIDRMHIYETPSKEIVTKKRGDTSDGCDGQPTHPPGTTVSAQVVNAPSTGVCPYNFTLPVNRRVGVYYSGGEWEFPVLRTEKCAGVSAGSSGSVKCMELSEIKITLGFRENNENYKVINDLDLQYNIGVITNRLTGFNPNYDQGAVGADCAFNQAPQGGKCNSSAGWVCENWVDCYYGGKAVACVPA